MFQFTPEQELLRKMVQEFAAETIKPNAAKWDEEDYCPYELFPVMGELGITGIFVPEEYGGAGMGHVERAICIEEIARYSAGLAIALMTHHLGLSVILRNGNDEQKKKYLPEIAAGKKLCGLATTEPGGGSDFAGQTTTAKLEGDNWILSGRKCFITNFDADVAIVTAVSGQNDKGRNEISAFIIEKGTEGFKLGRHENKLGLRGSMTGDQLLDKVSVPQANLIGKPGDGSKSAMAAIGEIGRAGMTAICVGILKSCVYDAVSFANERIVYGKPIARLQAIQFEIANIRTDYEASQLLLYRAASVLDSGAPADSYFSIAKYFSSEAAVRSSKHLIDLMGGYGVINEYPAGRYLRDAMAAIPSGGTSHVQQIVIAGNTTRQFV